MTTKKVLITGASRGIGKSCAILFAKNHYDLTLTCLHSEAVLKQLCLELIENYHIQCTAYVGNMGNYSFVSHIFEQQGEYDIVINNAGISHIGLLSDMSVEEWQHVMNTNLNSVFYTSRLAIPHMVHQKCGKIINISSVWGNAGASMEVAYSASKGGVNAFTKALAKELAPSNIQVNAIACGVIDTDMNQCFSEEERQSIIEEIPADRMGQPEEIAATVLMLATAPAYLTGQIITVDGGYL